MSRTNAASLKFCKGAILVALAAGLLLPLGVNRSAHAEEDGAPADLTAQCTLHLPEDAAGFASRFSDNRYNSRISFTAKQELTLDVPTEAKGIYIAWYAAPEACHIEALDSAGIVLSEQTASPDLLNGYYAMPDNCSSVRIYGEQEFAVSELWVYDSATPPDSLCIMTAQQPGAKVMLLATHTGDESYYFGSLLPFFQSSDFAVVYLMAYSREAQQEAIRIQYSLGSRVQPVFMGYQYYRAYATSKGMYSLVDKKEISLSMLQLIRRYQPEVIITNDISGEDGDCMHMLTATHVQLAAEQAADDSKDHASLEAYGAWQVSAVYQHRSSGGNALYDTSTPLAAFDGLSAQQLAQSCFDQYDFLKLYHADVTNTPYFQQTYPEDAYVTEPESQTQLFEILSGLSAETSPLATVSPEPTQTPLPSASPAAEATAAPADNAAAPFDLSGFVLPVGISLVVLGAGLLILFFAVAKKRMPTKLVRILFLSAAALFALAGTALILRDQLLPQASPEATPSPTPAAETPAPTDTPEPTPTPEPFAEHFRQESDPEEVVVFDYENGIFEYRSDTLAVEIKRYTTSDPPETYFVAHIYMRDEDAYRSGFGSARLNGRDTLDACTMARRYRAVLGLTGDNLLHSGYDRGLLIRDGRIFRALSSESCMVLTDDLSMRIYEKGDASMLNEIEDGVQATFAFGPPLILNGELCEGVDGDRVGRINPRAGLGLVEPGHFVAIVVDGRLPGYSHGILLSDFAKMFQDEGCVMAYNLDGGASATMVFMGEYINLRAEKHYRAVPDQLLWGYSELVPTEDEPRLYTGLVASKYD
ncbi:MAG: phosphodiester glycosidase family protein [Clostridiaceae bacterium]